MEGVSIAFSRPFKVAGIKRKRRKKAQGMVVDSLHGHPLLLLLQRVVRDKGELRLRSNSI